MASISAADTEIGDMISEAIDKVGKDGVITVEESQTFGMDMDLVEGMRFDKGYIAPYFVTDPERMEAVLEDAYVLLVGSKITAVRDLLPVLEKVMQSGKPLRDHRRGRRGRGPGHPGGQQDPRHVQERRRQGPRASASAARPCSRTSPSSPAARSSPKRSASSWRTSTLDLLGTARKVVVTKDETTIVEGAGTETDIKGRINQIKTEIENTDSDYDREKLQERLAKLSGGVAVIKVGAATEVELKEKKHRIEDAVSTTKAAIEEGVVPGGGVALLRAQAAILEAAEKLEGDEATGARIVARAVEEPLKQIAVNAGLEGGVIVDKVRNLKKPNEGLNAATGEYEDLFKAGVIDAAKVTRSALQNAASIAALFLTTEAVIVDKPEEGAGGHARRRDGRLLDRTGGLRAGRPGSARSDDRAPTGRPSRSRLTGRSAGVGRRSRRTRTLAGRDRIPSLPSVGWGVLHLFCQLPGAPAALDVDRRVRKAVKAAEADDYQVVPVALLGHKADLGLHGARPRPLAPAALPDRAPGRRARGGRRPTCRSPRSPSTPPGVPEEMRQARLYPQLPPEGKRAFCFYPMSKRRGRAEAQLVLPSTSRSARS